MVKFSGDCHQRSASGGSVLIVFGTSN
jgi:hypothetical protein